MNRKESGRQFLFLNPSENSVGKQNEKTSVARERLIPASPSHHQWGISFKHPSLDHCEILQLLVLAMGSWYDQVDGRTQNGAKTRDARSRWSEGAALGEKTQVFQCPDESFPSFMLH